ncbi:MAG TPA: lysophospholipid acyltransferase family protein [Polyangiaceae bacterium]|jgi:1-acyl-sn-glycerol-3-phosphate acyltransferase|nr:lysophospholipid acyltransferase family protein [Polyangiaceae bacterium]
MLEEVSHPFRYLRSQWLWSAGSDRPRPRLERLSWGAAVSAHARARSLSRACRALCEVHGVSLRVTGRVPEGPAIFVSNHLGYIDPIAICSLVPCAPVAKEEVADWPVVGQLCRRLNVIFVRRSDPASGAAALWRAMRTLEAGVSVLNFPEGTTTRGATRLFQRGIFGLSALMNIPIVPLSISFDAPELCWVDDETLLGHYSSEFVGRSPIVHVEVGPGQYLQRGESAAEFAARVRLWIVRAGQAAERARAACLTEAES